LGKLYKKQEAWLACELIGGHVDELVL